MTQMRHPQNVVARLVAMRGIMTSGELAAEFGITRSAVLGVWNRASKTPGFVRMQASGSARGGKPRPGTVVLVDEPQAPEPIEAVSLPEPAPKRQDVHSPAIVLRDQPKKLIESVGRQISYIDSRGRATTRSISVARVRFLEGVQA